MQPDVLLALLFVSRLILGVVFPRSAWGKLGDIGGFARGLAAYQLLPSWAIVPLAWLLPFVELLLALGFLLGLVLPLAGSVAALLLVVFIAAIVINLRRGRVITCNCHGSAQQTPISWGLVARNTLLFALAVLLVVCAPISFTSADMVGVWQAERAIVLSPAVVPAAMVLCGICIYLALLPTVIDTRHTVRRVVQ